VKCGSKNGLLALPLLLLVLTSCKQQTQELRDGDLSDQASVAVAVLSEQEIASIRDAVQQCGGAVRLDQEGQPEAVDLAVERGSADKSGLQAALRCPRLKSLRIRAAGLSEEDLASIASLVSLEELFLQDVPIQDDLLAKLTEHLSSLRRVTLRNVPGVTSTESIVSLPQLTHLALIDMPIEADAIEPLREAKNLVSLDLRMCGRIGGDQLLVLADISGLKELKLGGYTIDNQSMVTVASMPALESLTIEDASIDAEGLAELVQIGPRLRSLSLARCSGLGDDELEAIGAFVGLRALVLRDMPVTGEFLQHLGAPERLETLSLNQTFLIEESIDAIVRCRHLKRLELAQNFLSPQAVEKISTLVDLEQLNLTECGLDAASLEPLKKLDNLKTLLVEGNSDVNAQTVQEMLGVSGAL
jgi:Leucine-rich repeat (LRR) protein